MVSFSDILSRFPSNIVAPIKGSHDQTIQSLAQLANAVVPTINDSRETWDKIFFTREQKT